MSPKRRGVLVLALLIGSVAALAAMYSSRGAPDAPRGSQPSQVTAARWKLQEALRDASLLDLIRNARVAARKGDSVTHGAMLTGLKREPQRSRTLIRSEITKSNDSADVAILNCMIQELP